MRGALLTAWAILKDNLGNRFTLFWVVLFPLVLTLLFALIFGGASNHYTVYVYGTNAPGLANYLSHSGLFNAVVSNDSRGALNRGYLYLYVKNSSSLTVLYPPQDGDLVKPRCTGSTVLIQRQSRRFSHAIWSLHLLLLSNRRNSRCNITLQRRLRCCGSS